MSEYEDNSVYQGEPPEWGEREVRQRALRTAIWLVSSSYRYWEPFRRNLDDFFDLYTNQPLKLRQTNRIRSNVPSGMVSEMVDTFSADMINQITKPRPMVAVVPEEPGDIDTANVLERKLQYDMDNWTPDMGFHPVLDQIIHQVAIYGSCPVKQLWDERFRYRMVPGVNEETGLPMVVPTTGFTGSICEPIFIYDGFPHPLKVWPDDNYPFAHISHQSYDKLVALKGIVYDDAVDDIPEKKDLRSILGDWHGDFTDACGDPYERLDQRLRLGWATDTRLAIDGVILVEMEAMFRPKIDWTDSMGRKHKGEEPIRTLITIGNGIVIRLQPSPLRDGFSIYENVKANHLPGQWYGQGLVQKNRPQVHVVDTVINMWLQNLAQTVNRPKVVNPYLLESGQSLDDAPGGLVRTKQTVTDVRNVVQEVQTTSVYNDVIGILGFFRDRAQGVGGETDLKQGRVSRGETTATESNIAFQQSSLRFKHALAWVGATLMLPSARKGYVYNRDYLNMPYAFRYFGQQGARHWQTIKSSDFITNVDFVFLGPTQMENENLRIAQLENFLKILSPFVQLGWAEPAIKEVIVDLADKFNIPNLDRLKELIGYAEPAPPPMMGEGGPGTAPGGIQRAPNRQDRRLGSGGPPTSARNIAKSMGGLLARGMVR